MQPTDFDAVAELIYPSVDELIETNLRVLKEIRAKRADQHRVLSRPKLERALQKVKDEKGDVYDRPRFF
jgi:hypothetical protein